MTEPRRFRSPTGIFSLNDLIHPETLAKMGECRRCGRPSCICPPWTMRQVYRCDGRALPREYQG